MSLSAISNTVVVEEAKNTLSKALAPLKKFTTDFKGEYAASTTFKVVSDGDTFATDPSSYAASGSTGTSVAVPMHEYNLSFKVTPADKRNGWRLADLIQTNARKFANNIHKIVMSELGTASVEAIGAANAFSKSKLKALSVKVDGEDVTAGLTPDYFVQIIPEEAYNLKLGDNGIYNFDGGVDKVSASVLPTGVVGYVASKDAIAVATAIPEIEEALKDDIHAEVIELPELAGMSVLMCNWIDTATRSEQISFGIMLGKAVLNAAQVKALKATA